ncbi:DUF2493 domain-containing protein [Sphingosinicella sp. CPCC 101087]|uniref:DUF2493 domain-containing protein n=1 Tax=Sphingosinicella sp. CPCC 101087 TaxID=2497754 RepID=UPI00101C545A|nr:DUF2493 domain-containing protein [Sphingosinicella sp. CPCC 101087]
MRTTFAAQLARLELGHLSIQAGAGEGTTDLPDPEAVSQTLAAVWSDLFLLFPGTVIEADAEEIGWAFVNLFHRAAAKRAAQVDRATDEIRCLLACADGSEVHSSALEAQVAKARAAEAAMLALEGLREVAAGLYLEETGSSWRPAGGSRLNHCASLTSAVVDGRAFLQARSEGRRRAALPEGTPVLFAGGRLSFPGADEARTFADNVWATLDRVREHVGDLVLVHGGDGKGADRLAAAWAERRKVPQVTFGLDRRLGRRAGFRRNAQMLSLHPRYVVVFAGSGVVERLVIEAKAQGIAVVDRRGPLGTHPKQSARAAA